MSEYIRSTESGSWYEADGADVTAWMAADDNLSRDDDGSYWDATDDETARWWCEFSALVGEREDAGDPWEWDDDAATAKDEMQRGRAPEYAEVRMSEEGVSGACPPESDGDPVVRYVAGWE